MNHFDALERVSRLGGNSKTGPAIQLASLLALFDSYAGSDIAAKRCPTCKGKGIVSCVKYPCLCGVCGGTGYLIRRRRAA